MKASLRKGAATPAPANARKWSDRDFPVPATRGKAKAEARTSIHFKILSRTK